VNNNSAGTLAPMIDCLFTNAGQPVEETRVLLRGVGAGVRGGITIYGPKTDSFVDRAACRVVSPYPSALHGIAAIDRDGGAGDIVRR